MIESVNPEAEENNNGGDIVPHRSVLAANKFINDESSRLITWSLSIVGGSILTMISSNYVQPSGPILYAYLLFVAGWSCMGCSIYFGESLSRTYIAGAMAPEDKLDRIREIGQQMNRKFRNQIKFFYCGIIIFAVWLIALQMWLIFYRHR